MRYWRAQATIAMDSGVPEDEVQNITHWTTSEDSETLVENATSVFDRVSNFYTAMQGALPGEVDTDIEVKIYNMADPTPRLPVYTQVHSITPDTTIGLPHEVALVLTLEGTPASGVNQRRQRGRLYFGPISSDHHSLSNGNIYVSSTLQDMLRDAGEAMATPGLISGTQLCIYSPTTDATATLAASFFPVTRGHVDNAWDTQRRRGPDATSRLNFVL